MGEGASAVCSPSNYSILKGPGKSKQKKRAQWGKGLDATKRQEQGHFVVSCVNVRWHQAGTRYKSRE